MPNIKQFKTHEEYLEWYRKYRNSKRVKLRNYNRNYNRVYRKNNGYANEKKSNKKFPEKVKARELARYAIRIGLIKRDRCEFCKNTKVHAHHDDYSKPLEVRWLCPVHHKMVHMNLSTEALVKRSGKV